MDYDAWTIDLPTLSATHACGFRLELEGSAKDPSAVFPGKFPTGLSSIEQVRLLRTGVEAIAKAASGHGNTGYTTTAPDVAALKATERKATADKYAQVFANKPERPVLSLKKRQPESV